MHSNASIQAMINKFGDRICAIILNNGKKLYIGYQGEKTSVQISNISFETMNGCDMMVVERTDISFTPHVTFKDYITTEFIEQVIVMDEDSRDYRVNPMHM